MRRKSRWNRLLPVIPALLLLCLGAAAAGELGIGRGDYAPAKMPSGHGVPGDGAGRETDGGTVQEDGGTAQEDGGKALAGQERPSLVIEAESKAAGNPSAAGADGETGEGKAGTDGGASLLFAGDVLLSDHVLTAYDRAGNIGGVLDEAVRQEIDQADIFMVNQEFPFSERGTAAADKQFTFRLPLSRVPVMNEMGVDIVTLANNHALDFGTDALMDTCAALDAAGILHVGAGADWEEAKGLKVMERGGLRFGFLGVSRVIPVANWAAGSKTPGMFTTYDITVPQVLEEIEKASKACDFLTVYVHWGVERETEPEEYQRALGKKYIDAGADLVVGAHPHVLQGIEFYGGKPIIYSLGNFVFGSSIPKTMLLEVDVAEDGAASLRLFPCTSSGGYTRAVSDPAAVQNCFSEMEDMSFGVSVDAEGRVTPR